MSHKPLIILSLALTLLVSFDYLAAWTVPPSNPPSGNIAAPLNTGTTEQIKDGVLGVSGLGVFGAPLFKVAHQPYSLMTLTLPISGPSETSGFM